jgi:tripartite ATP-independent transporter DctP family solute receptor
MEIYPSGQIGDQTALTEMLMNGTLDFFGGSVVAIENYINAFKIVDLPYLVYDYDTADKLYGGKIGQKLTDMLPSVGVYGLGWCEFGFRNTFNNVRPINAAADFSGIKMRSIESSISIDMWTALGANPTVMGWTEVYTGLQQGTVDGADGPIPLMAAARMNEVVKYMSTTQHMYTPGMIQASKMAMDKLPADVWALIQEVGAEAAAYMTEQTRAAVEKNTKTMVDAGLQVNEVSNEARAEMAAKCKPIYEKNREVIGAEFYDEVMAFLGR